MMGPMSDRAPRQEPDPVPEGTRTTVAVQWPVYVRLADLRNAVQVKERRFNMTLSDAIEYALTVTAHAGKP